MSHNHKESNVLSRLEELKQEAEKINESRIRLSAEIDRISNEKTKLEQEFITKYGTCDLGELEKILNAEIENNNKAIMDFETSVNETKQALTSIQQEISKLNGMY